MQIFVVIESYGSEGSGYWEVPVRHFALADDAEVFKTAVELHQLELQAASALGWEELRRVEGEFMKLHGLEQSIGSDSEYSIEAYEVY